MTSALHMPRSVGSFRAAGWQIVPYPVDYTTTGKGGGLFDKFIASMQAAKAA